MTWLVLLSRQAVEVIATESGQRSEEGREGGSSGHCDGEGTFGRRKRGRSSRKEAPIRDNFGV